MPTFVGMTGGAGALSVYQPFRGLVPDPKYYFTDATRSAFVVPE
jgi:hypothetical protein